VVAICVSAGTHVTTESTCSERKRFTTLKPEGDRLTVGLQMPVPGIPAFA